MFLWVFMFLQSEFSEGNQVFSLCFNLSIKKKIKFGIFHWLNYNVFAVSLFLLRAIPAKFTTPGGTAF